MQVLSGQSMPSLGGAGRLELAQQQVSMAATSNMAVRSLQVKRLLNNLLPEVCREHVYKVDHEHSIVDDCEIVKWTFFNDLSVRLKVAANIMLDSGEAEPIIEDYECWQADAIMKCEAGDDVWPRPKRMGSTQTPPGVSSLNSGQMNSLSGLAQQQSLAGSQHLNQSGINNALAGALGLGGLFK